MANSNNENIKSILLLVLKLQNLCEGFDETNKSAIITSKIKILLAVSEHGKAVSPGVIKTKVGLAKSNVTLACGKLVEEGLITKSHDNFDTREIVYSITDAGREYLNDFLTIAKKNFEGQLAYKNNMKEIKQAVDELLGLVN